MMQELNQLPQSLESASRRNLRRVFVLRSVMVVFLGSIAVTMYGLNIPMHNLSITLALSTMILLNLVTWLRLSKPKDVSEYELLLQLLGDIFTLTGLFYFTGGYSNPFVWMYLLPVAVGAVALGRGLTWLLAMIAVICYSALVFFHVPLSHLHMHYQEGINLDIHLVGMWLGFVVSACIIAFFVTRIGQNLRDFDHMIADARESALESERMMALGTLAASAAHELGTPLSTMAVISKELQREADLSPDARENLITLNRQIMRCKEILSSLSASSGQERAESGASTNVADFINLTLQRWRDTRPATTLSSHITPPAQNVMIFADRTLTQALQNMLDNAADASPEHIEFSASWDTKMLSIEIRDFGLGLSADALHKIGTPFFTSKASQGMGLGVYLTRAVLARYQGTLSLNNHPESGVLAEIKLPLTALITQTS